jgi:hypothetical protein
MTDLTKIESTLTRCVQLSDEEREEIMELLKQGERGECVWTGPQEFDETFETSCGQEFCWTEGTPQEHGVKFCHNCGKNVKFQEPALTHSQEGVNE